MFQKSALQFWVAACGFTVLLSTASPQTSLGAKRQAPKKKIGDNLPAFRAADLLASVVHIESRGGTGTGFWVSENLVVTCHHVVPAGLGSHAIVMLATESHFELRSEGKGSTTAGNWATVPAEVVSDYPEEDLVLLKTEVSGPQAASRSVVTTEHGPSTGRYRVSTLFVDEPDQMSPVFLAGFPLSLPYGVVQPGTFAAVTLGVSFAPGNIKFLVSTVANHGNSGGPVFNSSGQVIGVLEGALPSVPNVNEPAIAVSGLALVIPAARVQELIDRSKR